MYEKAVNITITGRVQGVGFRPFVYQLAVENNITGSVQNNMDGVHIDAQGRQEAVEDFLVKLKSHAPSASVIHEIVTVPKEINVNQTNFTILPSDERGKSQLVIPPDLVVCPTCISEMKNVENKRYRYPFINCTQCGPRYTMIRALPYDREYTTMDKFHMCPDCQTEYEDVMSRFYHAQPVACPRCGPAISLTNSEGKDLANDDPLGETIRLLKAGNIVAIKGIGGYHLCCDAANEEAIAKLRTRKGRPHRPLALMVASLEVVEEIGVLGDKERALLESKEAPIVILKRKEAGSLAINIAPGMKTIGVMLPYTPLHHLLLEDEQLSSIVFTSANLSGQPLLYRDEEAIRVMSGIADYILQHNREILHPIDDSVVQINGLAVDVQRRARGLSPEPISTKINVRDIVAFGAEQKITCAIGSEEQIFVSPHIGDMGNMETMDHYKKTLDHLLKWIPGEQKIAVIDAHPNYDVRHLLKEYTFKHVLEVQHHHAHMVACMAENKLTEKVWGIILDGTGYGVDGNIWGFEVLYGDALSFERKGHLRYTPLPGGEKAIEEPWRNAVAMLIHLLKEDGLVLANKLFPEKEKEIQTIQFMLDKKINTVLAGTCGRLFDAVSAMTGLCQTATYDGEAAITLSELAVRSPELEPYDFTIKGEAEINVDFSVMLREIAGDVLAGVDLVTVSSRFHETISQAIFSMMLLLHQKNPTLTKKVVLSGGSFHNRFLRVRLQELLQEGGFQVYVHDQIPCNDGGISFGQIFIAAAKRSAGVL